MTLAEARRQAARRLRDTGFAGAMLEADLLLAAATGLDRARLIAWTERALSATQQACFEQLLGRRLAGEPIAHLLGRREFWSLELQVTPDTLIPRPETETLVERALALLPADAPLQVADLGTGSGAIALALAHERPRWRLLAIDIEPRALAVVAVNAARLGTRHLELLCGNWSAALASTALDALVANPPYVRENDPHLRHGDLRFEPRSALAAGRDGLRDLRTIVADAPRCLRPGGLLALEHGWDQAAVVRNLLANRGFEAIDSARDLAGHERVTCARWPRD